MTAELKQVFHDQTDALLHLAETGGLALLYPHVRADGDALGACLGYVQLLNKAGIRSMVLAEEPVPGKFSYLPGQQYFVDKDDPRAAALIEEQAIAISLDSHGADRLETRQQAFEACPVCFVIDHHLSERPVHKHYYKDITAAATCEIVGDYVSYLEARLDRQLLDRDIATCLMTGLLTDTGRFSFTNTTENTLAVASRMMGQKVDMRWLTSHLFDQMKAARMALIGIMATRVRYHVGGRFAISMLLDHEIKDAGAEDSDIDGLAGMLRDVEGVDVSLLLREAEDGSIRGNLRSNERFHSANYARSLGGGGHAPAAGFTLTGMSPQEAWDLCTSQIASILEKGSEDE